MKQLLPSVLALSLFATVARADSVELVNGDVISGQVVSLVDSQLKLRSEALGELVIPRDKVARIHLGDRQPAKQVEARVEEAAKRGPKLLGQKNVKESVAELKVDGIDPATVNALKKKFPLLAAPGASKYFDDRVSGLATGRIDVQDIRKDAVKARDQLNDLRADLRKQLGPGADGLLKMYSGILDRFIQETTPPADKAAKSAPQEDADLGEPSTTPVP